MSQFWGLRVTSSGVTPQLSEDTRITGAAIENYNLSIGNLMCTQGGVQTTICTLHRADASTGRQAVFQVPLDIQLSAGAQVTFRTNGHAIDLYGYTIPSSKKESNQSF